MFHFNEIHDCVGKAASTVANQDRMNANSHQLSSSFDQVLKDPFHQRILRRNVENFRR